MKSDNLAIQTIQTARTMARLDVQTSDISGILCQALQNQYSDQEMKLLRGQIIEQAHQTSSLQIANQYAGSIGKGGNGSNSGDSGSGGGNSGGSGSGGSGGGGSGGGGNSK